MTEARVRRDGLEDALISLGTRLELPAEPQLARSVRAHLEAHPQERMSAQPLTGVWRFARLRPALGLAALVVCLAALVLVFSPSTRNAVADWIGLDGVRITYDEPPETPLGSDLMLGKKVTLDQATSGAGFSLRVPASLGDPDEVYIVDGTSGERVSLLYRSTEDLPRTNETGVGVLISQFPATLDRNLLLKKIVPSEGSVEMVEVAGTTGYWLDGEPHAVTYIDQYGAARQDQFRLAANTLLWQRDGIVYRIESSLSQNRSVAIAESMF